MRSFEEVADGVFQFVCEARDSLRICFPVKAANRRSTKFSQEALVGVKCR